MEIKDARSRKSHWASGNVAGGLEANRVKRKNIEESNKAAAKRHAEKSAKRKEARVSAREERQKARAARRKSRREKRIALKNKNIAASKATRAAKKAERAKPKKSHWSSGHRTNK